MGRRRCRGQTRASGSGTDPTCSGFGRARSIYRDIGIHIVRMGRITLRIRPDSLHMPPNAPEGNSVRGRRGRGSGESESGLIACRQIPFPCGRPSFRQFRPRANPARIYCRHPVYTPEAEEPYSDWERPRATGNLVQECLRGTRLRVPRSRADAARSRRTVLAARASTPMSAWYSHMVGSARSVRRRNITDVRPCLCGG